MACKQGDLGSADANQKCAGFVDFTNPKTVDCEEPASFAVRQLPKIVASKPNFKHNYENDWLSEHVNWLQSLILIHGPQIDSNSK